MNIIIYITVFVFGIVIGSFLNVCIYRIPNKETVVTGISYCMNCNKTLKWYDMIPVLSYLILCGKCRFCKSKISRQYPIVEALNGILWLAVFYVYGWETTTTVLLNIVYCLSISVLIVISVIDYRTCIIPELLNRTLLLLGLIAVLIKSIGFDKVFTIDGSIVIEHIIGFFAVSLFLAIVFYLTKGRGIGGGDVKLMAVAGLLLGWKLVFLSFFLGCIFALVIHIIKMCLLNADKTLAFGPYLSAGIIVAILYGNQIINWYITSVLQI